MKKLLTIISCFLILPAAFAYDLSCDVSRYMGLKTYTLSISDINTSYNSRSGHLELSDSQGKLLVERKIFAIADYLEGDTLLTIESRDLDVFGFINLEDNEGQIEINNKNYSVRRCEYTR